MRVIFFIFVLAGLTNAARDPSATASVGADVPQTQPAAEHDRSTHPGAFTPAVDARSQARRAGP